MSSSTNNVIIVCKENLYKGSAEDIIHGMKTMPTGLGEEEMKLHLNFIRDTAESIVSKGEQERETTLSKIILQETKLEDLRNEHVNIEDDNTIIDRIMSNVGCYTDCRMLKASIRRRKNLNKVLSEDEVLSLSLEKEKLSEIEAKINAAKDVMKWAEIETKKQDESKIIVID